MGVDFGGEAVGSQQLEAMEMEVGPQGGSLGVAGLSTIGQKHNLSAAISNRQEKSVKGSYYGTSDANRDFIKYAHLYLGGKLPIDKMISKLYSLEQVNIAYEDMMSGQSVRGIIRF